MKKTSLALIATLLVTTNTFGATLSKDIKNNSLIVYNGNIALVHEERSLKVDKNDKEIIYRGVAKTIETDSVNVELPNAIRLYSQQYRFDKLTQQKLLDAHIGKKIVVKIAKDSEKFQKISATLLSSNSAYSIVKTKDGEIISVPSRDIIFKTIPDELITKPSLVWNISAKKSLKSNMKIDYLIKKVNWKSNYILNIKGNNADLSGWIAIDNRSGKKFQDTELHVLAGEINRTKKPQNYYREAKAMVMAGADSVSHQAHEGYHFYTIPFKVNIANNETTQIKFIDKKSIPIERKYSTMLSNPSYFNGEIKHSVTQYIHINGVEFPLPKGVIRSYSKLQSSTILLGESNIKHTPKDTPIDLKLGKNFDLKVKETIMARNDTKKYRDATIKYTLKNSSKESKTVELLIPFNKSRTSTIETSKTYKFTKGNLVTFSIRLKGENSQEFKVRFRSKR
ncbi:MAG: hypothetical protein J7L21_06565 [Sulfurimonas sp.]|nr:hypothetical protein [Sulfurimonas sp.]